MSSGTLITLHHVARGIGKVSVIAFIFDYLITCTRACYVSPNCNLTVLDMEAKMTSSKSIRLHFRSFCLIRVAAGAIPVASARPGALTAG